MGGEFRLRRAPGPIPQPRAALVRVPNKSCAAPDKTSPEGGCPPSGLNKPDEGVGALLVLALQRREGWGGRPASLAGNRPASRGVSRRSEDADRIDVGWSWVPSRPLGVSTPAGPVFDATSHAAEAARGPSLRFRAPSEASVAAPCRPADPWAGSSDDTTSPGLCLPYDTVSERRRVSTSVPTGVLGPRRRFGYPLRDLAVVLPAREAPERPWASPFRAFPPCSVVPPLGGPALVALPAPAPHREVHAGTRPPSGRRSRHGSVRSRSSRIGRRCPPGVPPSRAFSPSVRAQRFGRAASPHTPVAG